MSEEFEQEAMDRQMLREYGRITSGSDAHHMRAPDEIAMANEEPQEERSDKDRLREEIFAATCDYTFSKGVHPADVREKIACIMRRFSRDTFGDMKPMEKWWNDIAVHRVVADHEVRMSKTGGADDVAPFLWSISKKIQEEDDSAFVYDSFQKLCEFWALEGLSWRNVVAVHFAIVKALRPQLISQMSLEDIAVLCGDAGKATVSARIKRLINRRLEAMGMLGTFCHFQKSPETVEKYRAAQMGNSNRSKTKPKQAC